MKVGSWMTKWNIFRMGNAGVLGYDPGAPAMTGADAKVKDACEKVLRQKKKTQVKKSCIFLK